MVLGRRGGGGIHIPIIGLYLTPTAIILIVLVLVSVFILPLTPTLRVAFTIRTTNSQPTLTIIDQAYAKVSLFATSSATKGNITLSYLAGSQGTYYLTIAILYGGTYSSGAYSGGTVLSQGTFYSLGDGEYQIYVAYFPRFGEQPNIPYLLIFNLYYQNGQVAVNGLFVTIYPT